MQNLAEIWFYTKIYKILQYFAAANLIFINHHTIDFAKVKYKILSYYTKFHKNFASGRSTLYFYKIDFAKFEIHFAHILFLGYPIETWKPSEDVIIDHDLVLIKPLSIFT